MVHGFMISVLLDTLFCVAAQVTLTQIPTKCLFLMCTPACAELKLVHLPGCALGGLIAGYLYEQEGSAEMYWWVACGTLLAGVVLGGVSILLPRCDLQLTLGAATDIR